MSKEKAVRDAAVALFDAIGAARKAGFVVAWPHSAEGLPAIAISETAKVEQAEPKRTATSPAK